MPSGYCNVNSTFQGINDLTGLWTSTIKDTDDAWFRDIYNEDTNLTRAFTDKNLGLSIRCTMDSIRLKFVLR